MGAGEEVGGDFYDAFGDRASCWLVVGDVCGKGAEAAALTGFLRHTTAAYARQERSPGKVLDLVNRAMLDQDFDGRFATAILARLRFGAAGVELTVALAGHPAALVVRRGGREARELGGIGTLLGIFPEPVIEEVTTTLEPGDALALYTDGLTEAHAPRRIVQPGELLAQLQSRPPASAQGTIDALLDLINLNGRVTDDIAVLAVQVRSHGSGEANGARLRRDVLTPAAPLHAPQRA
jgi:serine phosphatase RsbU (regulator of sigma subunit)